MKAIESSAVNGLLSSPKSEKHLLKVFRSTLFMPPLPDASASARPFCALGEILHLAPPTVEIMTSWKFFLIFSTGCFFPKKLSHFIPQ